jgi:uncharacterized protein (DUF4213/DUF364 family)
MWPSKKRRSIMCISERIQDYLKDKGEARVQEVRVGLRYTAVFLENGRAGVAFTFSEGMTREWPILEGLHPLEGRYASELLALLQSRNNIEMAVGLATANALANVPADGLLYGDALEYLHITSKDRVGMVGYFSPVVPKLRNLTSHVTIFEQDRERGEGCYPEEDAYRLLPKCEVAMITSTAILNHTIDKLLDSARSCREVALMGATTPLLPQVFYGTPVTLLSGVIVSRPDKILRIVSEGGGIRLFKDHVMKVNLVLKRKTPF